MGLFSNKNKGQQTEDASGKDRRSLGEIESSSTVLSKSEMNKVEGGKEIRKQMPDFSDPRDSASSTIPL
ncbi:MAG: hypothetical protein RJA20_1230 [Bacteroidota bacterium]|jgi:hypothetical protein